MTRPLTTFLERKKASTTAELLDFVAGTEPTELELHREAARSAIHAYAACLKHKGWRMEADDHGFIADATTALQGAQSLSKLASKGIAV